MQARGGARQRGPRPGRFRSAPSRISLPAWRRGARGGGGRRVAITAKRVRAHLAWRWGILRRGADDLTLNLAERLVNPARQRETPGALPAADRVAVLAVYPVGGIGAGHLAALRALAAAGHAPLVVVNGRLTGADRERLAAAAWRLIERPNLGHDLGAYRVAVLALRDRLAGLRRLILTNDSVWYPLPGCEDWPARAEAMGVDLAGAVANGFAGWSPRFDADRFAWEWDAGRPEFHYGSFALSLGPAILRDGRFVRFWRDLQLSRSKLHLVRRGEIGFTQWAIRAGFSHGATWDAAGLPGRLAGLAAPALHAVARGLVVPEEPPLEGFRAGLVEATAGRDDAGTADRLRRGILMVIARTGPAYAAPALAHAAGFPFLKKSPLRLSAAGAAATLAFARGLSGGAAGTIRAEAEAMAAARGDASAGGAVVSPQPVVGSSR